MAILECHNNLSAKAQPEAVSQLIMKEDEYSLSYVKLDDAIQGILDRYQGS